MSSCPSRSPRCSALGQEPRSVSDGVPQSLRLLQRYLALTDLARSVTSSDHVPDLRRSGKYPPVFSAHSDEPGGAGRPVTAVALVPILPGFLQQRRTLAQKGRPVTSADLPPLPPACAPGACADARAHRLERSQGPPLDAPSLAWRAVEAGSSYCTFFASLRPTALVRTTYGTRNSADVRACPASVSSTDAPTLPTPPRASPRTTMAWISSPPRRGSQIGRRQSFARMTSSRRRWPCRSSEEMSSGSSGLSRFPQIRSAASQRTTRAWETASS